MTYTVLYIIWFKFTIFYMYTCVCACERFRSSCNLYILPAAWSVRIYIDTVYTVYTPSVYIWVLYIMLYICTMQVYTQSHRYCIYIYMQVYMYNVGTIGTSFPSFPPALHKLVIPPYAHQVVRNRCRQKYKKKNPTVPRGPQPRYTSIRVAGIYTIYTCSRRLSVIIRRTYSARGLKNNNNKRISFDRSQTDSLLIPF